MPEQLLLPLTSNIDSRKPESCNMLTVVHDLKQYLIKKQIEEWRKKHPRGFYWYDKEYYRED